MRALTIALLLAVSGCMYTPDKGCAEALEKYARSLEAFKDAQTERNEALKALTSAMNGSTAAMRAEAARADKQTEQNERIIRQMEMWSCSPRGLPETPVFTSPQHGGG